MVVGPRIEDAPLTRVRVEPPEGGITVIPVPRVIEMYSVSERELEQIAGAAGASAFHSVFFGITFGAAMALLISILLSELPNRTFALVSALFLLTLAEILRGGAWSVAALVTTGTEGYERISMHGVRLALLRDQAAALGLALEIVYIPQNATNEIYEARMEETFERYRYLGVATIAFGDLFLADIRRYR